MKSTALLTLCDHLDVRVRDAEVARAFYDPFCAALGLTVIDASGTWVVYETNDPTDAFFAITSDADFRPSRSRIALRADSVEEVERVASAARISGATEFETPHDCPEYCRGYYASFFADPDGNRYEVCYRPSSPVLRTRREFTSALLSDGPSHELGAEAQDLAWLVGGWDAVVRDYDDDKVEESTGEWWFTWVLEGRAMQDVWIVPAGSAAAKRDRYGTTVRWLDRAAGLWKISWFNPVSGARSELHGGKDGSRLVFVGESNGQKIRWTFNDINPKGFVWRGEAIDDDGNGTLGSEFILTRKD